MYRTVMIGILGVSLMSLTACESMTGKTAGQTIDDATVTASVQKKLMGDKLSNFARISAGTDRGVVTLRGMVSSEEEKSRAEDLARQVSGGDESRKHLIDQIYQNGVIPDLVGDGGLWRLVGGEGRGNSFLMMPGGPDFRGDRRAPYALLSSSALRVFIWSLLFYEFAR